MGDRSLRLLNLVLGHLAVFGVAVAVSSSCGVDYPTTAFRCSPGGSDPTCPTESDKTYLCCSDDPTAIDLGNLSADATPNYQNRGGTGVPIFSGGNNPLSKTGMCVESGSVPPVAALTDINAQGCPVPCNPTWPAGDITAVCGAGQICCQTVELEQKDCVFDPDAGDVGCFRPATGADISAGLTAWAGTEHATHQDPSGLSCEQFVAGLPPDVLNENALSANDVLNACYRRLTTANQRGFCLGVALCPLAQPTYRDICEQLNDVNGLPNCASVEFP